MPTRTPAAAHVRRVCRPRLCQVVASDRLSDTRGECARVALPTGAPGVSRALRGIEVGPGAPLAPGPLSRLPWRLQNDDVPLPAKFKPR
jgi:hypothetical protein